MDELKGYQVVADEAAIAEIAASPEVSHVVYLNVPKLSD